MHRAARYAAGHTAYLSKRHGVASHITTVPATQPVMVGKWDVHKIHGYSGESLCPN